MKFPYVKIHGDYEPIIPLELCGNGRSISTDALVDSGADASLFHATYAEEIGIDDIKDGPQLPFYGISGAPVRGYVHDVEIEIGGNRFGPIGIAFSRDLSPDAFNILGQRDFFALFPVKFTYSKLEIKLSYSPS